MINRYCKIYRNDDSILVLEKKFGLIDDKNNIYLDCVYDAISLFSHNYAEVVRNGKLGLINIGGNLVLECKYDAISEFDDNNLARVSYKGKEGLFSSLGKWLIEPLYPIIYPAYNDKYIVCRNEQFSEINEKDVNVINTEEYERGLFYIGRDYNRFHSSSWINELPEGKYGLIDSNGNIIVDFEYDKIFPFKDGLALAVKGNLKGVIDEFGSIIVPIIYDEIEIEDFWEGYATVRSKDKCGVINTLGELIIPLEFDKCYTCSSSKISMQTKNDIYDFNSKGELIGHRKEFVIPRLDNGCYQLGWNECFKNMNLNFSDSVYYKFYEAMELLNERNRDEDYPI